MTPLIDARRNLATHFRAVFVAVEARPDTGRLLPAMPALARWLDEYHRAYLEAHVETEPGQPFTIHNRALTLEGDALLGAAEEVAALVAVASRCGLGVALGVSLAALAAHPHVVAALHAVAPLVQYRINCTSLQSGTSELALQRCRATLTEHAARGGSVTLVGDLGPLRAAGLFEAEVFNKTFISLHQPGHGVRPQQRSHDFAPCRDYIAWHVDADGEIYPCAGLFGHAPARFGSIHEPFTHLMDALAYSERSIDALARRGPRLADDAGGFPADLCALHRAHVHGLGSL